TILNENVLSFPEVQHTLEQSVELSLAHRLVHRSPVDRIFGAGFANEILIFRRPSGELAGVDHEGSAGCERSFATLNRLLDQLRVSQVPISSLVFVQSMPAEFVAT